MVKAWNSGIMALNLDVLEGIGHVLILTSINQRTKKNATKLYLGKYSLKQMADKTLLSQAFDRMYHYL